MIVVQSKNSWELYIPTNKGLKFVGVDYTVEETIEFLKNKGLTILTNKNEIEELVEKANSEMEDDPWEKIWKNPPFIVTTLEEYEAEWLR